MSTLKTLNTKDKIGYIWDYYRIQIALVILAIIVVISFGVRFIRHMDTNVYCLIFNDTENEELEEHIKSSYSEYIENDKVTASVDNSYMFSYVEEHGLNWPDDGTAVNYMTLQSTGDADVIITDYDSMLWAKYEDFIFPVEDVLPEDLYKKLEPYFTYAIFKDDASGEGDGIVYGLDISDSPVYKGHSLNYTHAILCFPNVSTDKEAAIRFTKFIYNLK